MLANFSRVNTATDFDELVLFTSQVNDAIRTFVDLGDRFRKVTSRHIPPSVLKHEINNVFARQAGDLLCQCWRRRMLSVYRPYFYLPEEDEPRIRYVFSWFTFIRWHLATIFKSRFRDDWKSEFAPEMDQLKGQDHHSLGEDKFSAIDDAKDLVVWRLNLYAEVQATACDILAEELRQLADAVEQRLMQLRRNPSESPQGIKSAAVSDKNDKQVPAPPLPKEIIASWREIVIALGMRNNDEDKRKVERLNETYNGPIMKPGQGKQPIADKVKLLEWWNNLEKLVESQMDQARDARLTVQDTHAYGREGEVVPEISGQVKKRRKDRQP